MNMVRNHFGIMSARSAQISAPATAYDDDADVSSDDEEPVVEAEPYNQITERVQSLYDRWRNDRINLSPEYQRDDVWSLPTRQALVKTFFLREYVPPIVLSENPDHTINVVDGKQRLTTLFMFLQDEFRFKGKFFSNLPRDRQIRFQDAPVLTATHRGYNLQRELELFQNLQKGMSLSSGEQLNACCDVEIMRSIKKWVNDIYVDIFPHNTSSQKLRHDNLRTAIIAVIMIATDGKPVISVKAQMVWLANVSESVENLHDRCVESLDRVEQLQLDYTDFYFSLMPMEIIYLLYFLSTPHGKTLSTYTVKERASRVHDILKSNAMTSTSVKSLKFIGKQWSNFTPKPAPVPKRRKAH